MNYLDAKINRQAEAVVEFALDCQDGSIEDAIVLVEDYPDPRVRDRAIEILRNRKHEEE